MERYDIVKDLGSGNFGVAKLVRDKLTTELLAVKFIERGHKIDEHVQREIMNHRSLNHPNIVRFKESQNTSLQRLQNDEKWIVRVLDLAGGVMEEPANLSGPMKELVNNHCSEFMQLIKDIQVTLREEIKSACEYRPFEKCDYVQRISNELCRKKLEYVITKIDEMKKSIEGYHDAA